MYKEILFYSSLIILGLTYNANSADFMQYGLVYIDNNTTGTIALDPKNNRLTCTATVGDIACDPAGQKATIEIPGSSGTIVNIYCPASAEVFVENYGLIRLNNIKIAKNNGPSQACTSSFESAMTMRLKKNQSQNRIHVGGELRIQNIQDQQNPASYFTISIVYQ